MYDYALAQYAWQLEILNEAMAMVADADLACQPIERGNHPAWIVGHLAVSSNNVLKLAGQPSLVSEEWSPLFGRGSQPTSDRGAYPSKDVLLESLSRVHTAVTALVPNLPREVLDRPNPVNLPQLRSLPTVGNIVMHLLTTHEAFHLGQLSAWRRAMGHAPMF